MSNRKKEVGGRGEAASPSTFIYFTKFIPCLSTLIRVTKMASNIFLDLHCLTLEIKSHTHIFFCHQDGADLWRSHKVFQDKRLIETTNRSGL